MRHPQLRPSVPLLTTTLAFVDVQYPHIFPTRQKMFLHNCDWVHPGEGEGWCNWNGQLVRKILAVI